MTSRMSMSMHQLHLRNFRCFEECKIQLHEQLTVLIAENGHGKTAVLDAIGIALGLFVDTIAQTRQLHGFDRTDVHLVQSDDGSMQPVLPTEFLAEADIGGEVINWSRALGGYSL